MGDIVTFTLELNEKLSGGIQKAAVTTHSAFGGINDDISKTAKGLDDLGNERKIRVDHGSIGEATGAVEGLTGAMERLSEAHLIGGMALGELVARGVEKTADFAKEQIKDVLGGGMEEGKLQLEMQVLAGDDAGKDLYEQIHNYIPKSLFGPELNHEAVVLLGMGETMKNILPDLQEFGDISMGDDQKMQSLILALGEAKAQGHLSGMEMRILRTTGFNPLVETARVTGESMTNLTARMAEGKFSFNDLRKSMEYAVAEGGRFHDMQNRILQTPGGQYKEMVTNIEQAKTELGLALLPSEAEVMKAFMPLVERLPEDLKRMQPALEAVIHDFADMVHWVSNNTDTLGKWVGVIKVGVEAYVAWKVGTVAMTAANWLWTASVGAETAATIENTTAVEAQTAALAEQGAVVEGLGLKWAGMGLAEREALIATSQASFALPISTMGAAEGASLGAAGLAGGFAAGVSSAVIPVAVMYFGAQAGEAMGLWKVKSGWDLAVPDAILIEMGTDAYSQGLRDKYAAEVKRDNLQRHPAEYAFGWDLNNMVDPGKDLNGALLDKYGVKDPNYSKAKGPGEGGLSSAADSIIGGGPKQIHISAKFVVEKVVVNSATEGAKQVIGGFKEQYYEMLKGIPGMH